MSPFSLKNGPSLKIKTQTIPQLEVIMEMSFGIKEKWLLIEEYTANHSSRLSFHSIRHPPSREKSIWIYGMSYYWHDIQRDVSRFVLLLFLLNHKQNNFSLLRHYCFEMRSTDGVVLWSLFCCFVLFLQSICQFSF